MTTFDRTIDIFGSPHRTMYHIFSLSFTCLSYSLAILTIQHFICCSFGQQSDDSPWRKQTGTALIMASFPLLQQQTVSNFPILCFHNVQNATSIRAKLNELSTESTSSSQAIFKRLAIADLSNVVSAFHLQLAAYKTLQNEHQGSMKAKSSVVSEFLYHVSPTCKITDGIDNTRIQNDSTEIAFVYIPPTTSSSSSSSSSATTTSEGSGMC